MNAHAKYICIADSTFTSRQSSYNQMITQERYLQKQNLGSPWQNLYARRICTHRFMVRFQSVQGVALKKRLQSPNESGTFVNSSNGTHFSPKSLSDRLSRRNDGLIPAWTSQVMVYVNRAALQRGGGGLRAGAYVVLQVAAEGEVQGQAARELFVAVG